MSYQAGWYADPKGRFDHRYFDGAKWSEHVAKDGNQAVDPLDQPAPVATSPAPEPTAATATKERSAEPAQPRAVPKAEETIVTAGGGPAPPAAAVAPAAPPAPARVQSGAAPPAPAPVQYAAVANGQAAAPDAVAKRRKVMSWVMMGCAAAVFLSAFLPWLSSENTSDTLSGFSWGPGKFTALLAIGLGLYAAQGLSSTWGRVRFHGWVIPIIALIFLTAAFSQGIIDEVDQATFGVSGVEAGFGLILTFLVSLVAIWPLVMLWRANPKPRQVVMVTAQPAAPVAPGGQVPPAPVPAPAAPAALALPADRLPAWQRDPSGRFELRYFDGSRWTEHVAKAGAQAVDPV